MTDEDGGVVFSDPQLIAHAKEKIARIKANPLPGQLMLTPSERQSLRQRAKENSAFFKRPSPI